MSSFVSEYPVIRALLVEHRRHNLEYSAVAPFQTALNALFLARDGYAVNVEQSVDRGRGRVDLWIRGYDSAHLTLYPIVVGEMKGSYKPAQEGERQVLIRAREAIAAHGLLGIYAFTTLGEGYRFWTVTAEHLELEPFDSEVPKGSRDAYTLLDSEEGANIVHTCSFIKENRPLRAAPVVPSQNIPDFSQTNQPESSSQYEQDNTHSVDPSSADQPYPYQSLDRPQGQEMEIDDTSAAPETVFDEPSAGASAGASDEVHRLKKPKMKEVRIEKRDNNPGYKFVWKGRSEKVKTEKDDWERNGNVLTLRERHHGYIVWGYKP